VLSTIQEIAARMAAHGAVLPGKTIRIDAKDAGVIHLDGVNGRVLPGGDAPAALLLARCRQFLIDPPPADWAAVTVMGAK